MTADLTPDHSPSDEGGWTEVLKGPQSGLTVGLTLLTLSVATESLVITTIMPAIVRDIGGLSLYGLAFSAFFLAGLISIPIAGWAVDRFGPALPFGVTIVIFIGGTIAASLAPTMLILVCARAAQGLGAAAQFTISQSTIASAYPKRARVRLLSVMSATWTVPGLLGPSLGAAITSLAGWRWAFAAILAPSIVAAGVTLPRLMRISHAGNTQSRPPLVRPVLIAAGVALFLSGLTSPSIWSLGVSAAGLAIAVESLIRVLPPGAMLARPGLPAVVSASFFLNFCYYSASSFVALVLVELHGVTVLGAGVAITVGTIAWTVGVWANTILVQRYSRRSLVAISAACLGLAVGLFATTIYGAPLAVAFIAWSIAGLFMGICFNTLTLNTMDAARTGGEGKALAARNLMGNLGTAAGTGIGGSAIAVAELSRMGLRPGLIAAYALAVVAALATAGLARRASMPT